MRRVIGAAVLALVLAGCGLRLAPDSGRASSQDPASPRVLLDRVVVRILHQVPVPAGSHSATSSEAKAITWLERPSGPDLIDEHATYVVPMSAAGLLTWYGTHKPPHGKPSGSSSAPGAGEVTTEGLTFDVPVQSAAYQSAEVQVGIQSRSADQALLRIDVQATWVPSDSDKAYVPRSTTTVDVRRVSNSGVVQRATLAKQPARELAALIDQLQVVPPGTYNCPDFRGGHDVLTFHGPWPDYRYQVSAGGCAFIRVKVGGSWLKTSLSGGFRVDTLVGQLLAASGH